jgi:DNA ligase (NAD+)
MPDLEKDITRLRAEIAEHDRLYYKAAQPKIDDQAYDRLKLELAQLEATRPEFNVDASPTPQAHAQPRQYLQFRGTD